MAFKLAVPAQSGFRNAASYDMHRPSYPPEIVNSLLDHLQVKGISNARILELAAGTGKFTQLLGTRVERYEILAVEPHADMRSVLEAKALANVKVMVGSAEEMTGVADGWADAVIVAQAFHWFATVDALREIHRALAPGGALGLIWNIEDYNSCMDWTATTVWEGKLKDIIWAVDDGEPRFRHNEWRKVFDDQLKTTPTTILTADLFSLPLGEESARWTVWLTEEAIWDRFYTISHIALLKGEQLEETKRKVFEIMKGEDVEKNDNGQIALHGQTLSYWTTAIPDDTLKSGGGGALAQLASIVSPDT